MKEAKLILHEGDLSRNIAYFVNLNFGYFPVNTVSLTKEQYADIKERQDLAEELVLRGYDPSPMIDEIK